MPPKAPSPRRVAAAVTAVKRGRSLRDVAEEYGVSFVTVSRWVAKAKKEAKAPEVDPPWKGLTSSLTQRAAVVEEAEAAPEPPEDGSPLEQARALQRYLMAAAKDAKGVGDLKAARAALASAGLLMNTIARLSRAEVEGADVFKISRSEIATTEATLRKRLGTMAHRPLLCEHCSRRLSVELAYEGREKPDVIEQFLEADSPPA